ncbi:helix-turn-helix transcriptional regulator [Evansella sp. AB-P1]|uniref:helix-turn-helix domain-containing protein n=1 Tax=Evansella sp. AB-P1 TaxID=3037653 RepID=UPI0024200578|nr:helix-turn-helix transcriptional regulator [Evansella sp. AB-P1]MDG5789355.1 helix-turn-helix transcriptional regulator [Evansella sp. AB-P1]
MNTSDIDKLVMKLHGEKVRALRKEKGLSLEELAHRASISTSFLDEVERGKKDLTIISLLLIAFGLDLDDPSIIYSESKKVISEYLSESKEEAK